jgi:PAS domain S-box-containing protein
MDLLSDPLNLKRAHVTLDRADRQTVEFFRAYPHGAVHKKPRLALHERCDVSVQADTITFPLRTDGRSMGSLELTPYGESQLTREDESYVRRLCDVFSSGIERMLVPTTAREMPAMARQELSAAGLENPAPEILPGAAQGPDIAGYLMNMLPHGVIICSREGEVTTVNESVVRVMGIPREELEGQDIREILRLLAPKRENGVAISIRNLAIGRALRTGYPAMNVRSFISVNGSRREIIVSAIPYSDTTGDVAGCLATIRDVTVINSIVRLGHLALSVASVDDLVEESLDLIMNAMSLRLVSLYLWDGCELMLKVQKGKHDGMPLPDCRDIPDHLNPTVQSRAFLKGKPLLIKDYRRCASVRLFDPLARKRPIRSMACVPLQADSKIIGVLVVATGEGHPMDEGQLSELSALCNQMAAGVDRACLRPDRG